MNPNDWKLVRIHDGSGECKIDALKFAEKYISAYWISGEMEAYKVENNIKVGSSNNPILRKMYLDEYHKQIRPVVLKILGRAVKSANNDGCSVRILDLI